MKQTLSFFPRLQNKKNHSVSNLPPMTSPNNAQLNNQNNKQNTYAKSVFIKKGRNSETNNIFNNSSQQAEIGKTIIFNPGQKIQNNSQRKQMHEAIFQKMDLENQNVRSDIVGEMEKQIQKLNQDLKNEKSEKEQLILQLKELQAKINIIVNQNEIYKDQLHVFSTENIPNDSQKLKTFQIELNNLKTMKESLERKLSNQEKESGIYLKNCKKLQEQLNQAQKKIQEQSTKILDMPKEIKRRQSQELEEKIEKQEKSKSDKLKKQIKNLQEDNHDLNKQQQDLQEELRNFYDIKPSREDILRQLDENEIKIGDFDKENQNLKLSNSQLEKQLIQMKIDYGQIKTENETFKVGLQNEKNIQDKLKQEKDIIEKNLSLLNDQIQQCRTNFEKSQVQIDRNIKFIKNSNKSLESNLKCSLCELTLDQPVTVIPCGHCYCKEKCSSGYINECMKCDSSKVKVEAVYRNEVLDDVLVINNTLTGISKQLQTIKFSDFFSNISNQKILNRSSTKDQIQQDEQNEQQKQTAGYLSERNMGKKINIENNIIFKNNEMIINQKDY